MPRPRIALLALVLTAACADLTGGGREKAGQIRFDLRAQQQQQEEVSVIARAVLSVEPTSGRGRQFEYILDPSQRVATLPVRVRAGTVRFVAQVWSNNGTLLLSGEQSAEILSDGFQVAVPLTQQHAPVLFLSPPSLNVRQGEVVFLTNRVIDQGLGRLEWSIGTITPQVRNCFATDFVPPCLALSPLAGVLAPLDTHRVVIVPNGVPQGNYTVRITSRVGDVDLVVTVPQ